MQITALQQDLSRGLAIVGHALSNRGTLPMLNNVLLSAEDGQLKLAATNLEMGITCRVPCQVQQEGATTLPAKLLTDAISSLPPGTIDISVPDESTTATIKDGRSTITIKGMDAIAFPTIPALAVSAAPITVDASLLKEMITQVAFAATTDASRPVFSGVLVQVSNEQITFAAADAFRLAVRSAHLLAKTEARSDMLIPANTLTELGPILPVEGSVQLIVTPNQTQVLFHTVQIDLVSRLIEGAFLNFRQIIPKEYSTRAVIASKAFATDVKRAALFAHNSSHMARLTITPGANNGLEPGTVTIETTADDLGSNVSTISAAVDGPAQQIVCNVTYLADVLAVIGTPEVALEVQAANKPILVRAIGEIEAQYVIMPIHTHGMRNEMLFG